MGLFFTQSNFNIVVILSHYNDKFFQISYLFLNIICMQSCLNVNNKHYSLAQIFIVQIVFMKDRTVDVLVHLNSVHVIWSFCFKVLNRNQVFYVFIVLYVSNTSVLWEGKKVTFVTSHIVVPSTKFSVETQQSLSWLINTCKLKIWCCLFNMKL